MKHFTLAAAALVGSTYAHGHHDDQTPIEGPHQGLWYNTLPGDGGTQVFATNSRFRIDYNELC
jgi:agmatinase